MILTISLANLNSFCNFRQLLLTKVNATFYSATWIYLHVFTIFITPALKVSTASYDNVKKILISTYSTLNVYLKRIDFHSANFASSAEAFVSIPNEYVDRFDDFFLNLKSNCLLKNLLRLLPKKLRRNYDYTLLQPLTKPPSLPIFPAFPFFLPTFH